MKSRLLVLDVVAVVVFVAIGRDTHGRDATFAGFLATAAPFLIAVAAGWVVARAWTRPVGLQTGGIVVGVTLLVGMVVRRAVFNDGIATSFIAVTALFLALFMLGWRVLAAWWWRRRSPAAGRAVT